MAAARLQSLELHACRVMKYSVKCSNPVTWKDSTSPMTLSSTLEGVVVEAFTPVAGLLGYRDPLRLNPEVGVVGIGVMKLVVVGVVPASWIALPGTSRFLRRRVSGLL